MRGAAKDVAGNKATMNKERAMFMLHPWNESGPVYRAGGHASADDKGQRKRVERRWRVIRQHPFFMQDMVYDLTIALR